MNRRTASVPHRSLAALVVALAAAALSAGCGSDEKVISHSTTLYPVKGSVVLESGKALSGGHVVFVSADGMHTVQGPISSDGTFQLKSGDSEGAPAGDYKVRIEPDTTGQKSKGSTLPFSKKYLDEDGSQIKVTVKAEPNNLAPFKLSSKEEAPGVGGGAAGGSGGKGRRDHD